jgi:glycosyltransferase involved in cell wall biosynthesis
VISKRRIWVVVPAYEEAVLIGKMLRSLPASVDGVLVVDDASTDETAAEVLRVAELAQQPQELRPTIHLLRHAQNRGVGAAITTGYEAFLSKEPDARAVCVVMGGDNQMDPCDLDALVGAIDAGADYAKGNRFSAGEARHSMPRVRWFGNVTLTLLTRWATGLWTVTDSQCGYAAISRTALERLRLPELYARYGFPNDMLLHLAARGMRVVDVPVRAIYAGERSKIRLPRVAPRILLMLLLGWVDRQRCSGGPGLLLLLLALVSVLAFTSAFLMDSAGDACLLAGAAGLALLLAASYRESHAPCASSR